MATIGARCRNCGSMLVPSDRVYNVFYVTLVCSGSCELFASSMYFVHVDDINHAKRPIVNAVQLLETRDWKPEVLHLHRSKPKAQALRNPKAVNQALQSGAEVSTVKKFEAGSNKKSGPLVNPRKLDEGTEAAGLERLAGEVRHAIQKARVEKKMSQAEVATQINERTRVVQEYENGKAVPNQAVLAKMERVLGVKLRGKIGK